MSHLRTAVAALLLAPIAAFAHDTSEIEMAGGSLMPSVGLSIDIIGESALPKATRRSHAVDMGWTAGRGRDEQELDGGDRPIVFGGETFAAPQDIHYTANIRFAHLMYRYRHYFGQSNFAIDGMVGLGYASLGLKAVGATQTAAENFSNGGLAVGIGGTWRFRPATALQARLIVMGSGREEGVTSASRFDLGVVHSLGEHFAVRAALGSIGVSSAREDADHDNNKSPIRASVGGITVGFDLLF